MKKIFIATYGCQANKADSESMAGLLLKAGHVLVKNIKEADTVIVNTCSVKDKTQSKELHFINTLPKDKKIIVGGCLTRTINVRKYTKDVNVVFDTNSITKINEIVNNNKDYFSHNHAIKTNLPKVRIDKDIGIIMCQEGCLSNCSFCSTRLARGTLKSYRIGDIKRELERAVAEGCRKIYLTSQDNGCYGFDIKTSLPELLNEISTVEGNYKIRVGMANPWHVIKILEPLIESFKKEKIMKFIHIPLQSGSEKVLRDMKRNHSAKDFKKIVKRFREEFKDITISTDIIVGYPTETQQDFQETIKLIKEVKPEVINISKYSARPNTKASKLKQVPSDEIKRRSKILTTVYNEYRKK